MNPFGKRKRKRGRQQGCPHLWKTEYLPELVPKGGLVAALEIRRCQHCPEVRRRTVFVHA